jgi:hypothetical protein
MTEIKSFLMLKRLVVYSGEKVAYDESFHVGLNIIRGENSSGKSTILDFIFYVLGGEVAMWKDAASKCTAVSAEVDINGVVLTLQREVSSIGRRPMEIYYGPLEESKLHRFKDWKVFPYSSSSDAESFSKILFRLLGYPEVTADLESNLTIHQILRLAYVDQISRTTALMREEDFDKPLIRRTIAELMFGVYDDTLYADELNLKDKRKELELVTNQIVSVTSVMEEAGKEFDADYIDEALKDAVVSLELVNRSIEEALNEETIVKDTSATETEKLRQYISKRKQMLASLEGKADALAFDILDSAVFLDTLKNRSTSLNESLVTRDSLGELPMCPLCEVPVKDIAGKATCELSGKLIPGDFGKAKMLKMRDELSFQLKESVTLQEKRIKEEAELKLERVELESEIEQLTRTYRQKVSAVKTARNNRLDELYQKKGQLDSMIEYNRKLAKYVDILRKLKKRQVVLNGHVAELTAIIDQKRKKQSSRWFEATTKIQDYTREILSHDFKRQEEFSNVESVTLSFQHNTYLLNGKNNFSASSNAVLKNSIHFAILFASIDDAQFRYPRFLLCDNVEDGGMEKARSQNFQKAITEMAVPKAQPFQIIFSTSEIEERLENSQYCVGEHYTKERKSLRL